MLWYRNLGERPERSPDWQNLALLSELPPRRTRYEPREGPAGLTAAELSYAPNQSWHVSKTLPCMSYSPHGFGFF